jgi:hypothetical protein
MLHAAGGTSRQTPAGTAVDEDTGSGRGERHGDGPYGERTLAVRPPDGGFRVTHPQ